jgi:hypothetical protein
VIDPRSRPIFVLDRVIDPRHRPFEPVRSSGIIQGRFSARMSVGNMAITTSVEPDPQPVSSFSFYTIQQCPVIGVLLLSGVLALESLIGWRLLARPAHDGPGRPLTAWERGGLLASFSALIAVSGWRVLTSIVRRGPSWGRRCGS